MCFTFLSLRQLPRNFNYMKTYVTMQHSRFMREIMIVGVIFWGINISLPTMIIRCRLDISLPHKFSHGYGTLHARQSINLLLVATP
jgi:hypothetical protein